MKRYWLFMCNEYYPNGGMNDYKGDYDSIEECKERMIEVNKKWEYDHYHILDTENKMIVEISEYKEVKTNITVEELYKQNNP